MALFIFGAGATRGCKFVKPDRDPCLPPLNSDFYTQLQRIQNMKHYPLIKNVMTDVVEIFGSNFKVTMEEVFTTLEHTIKMLEVTGDNRAYRKSDLVKRRDRLLQAIAAVFEDSLTKRTDEGRSRVAMKSCGYHDQFVSRILKRKDEIIGYNYDCVLDHALQKKGSRKWNAHYGYGFFLGSRGTHLSGEQYWQPRVPSDQNATVQYYKLHGSLHFNFNREIENAQVEFKQKPYTRQRGDLQFTIIPPEWNKSYDKGNFAALWKKAASAIKRATEIIFIGYSLPPIDLHSTALFRTSIKKGQLKSLVVVNPDKEVRSRTRSVLQKGISKHTKVISFDYFKEFIAMPRSVWD